ncbi:hypothetical protein PPL_06642 [Heterostelium album PN500]|uniref:Uncharacterized protein n=1 Tax=Heterostelium pallidum (strain ATCC 26659 / Pp 5 / PN500) TaxID=670386 RepID=D3BFA9_HETP5|nr:hypothetical protein PPL_06642 [Heterostelium album PN500]EFA79823.1 hypothetical protein PPL_06642 [Heterostelium album PN500]|eukprot:XP_020431944.1 hypothetical protein PPL_06642 [Heterostelium album PN500]
MEDLTEKLEKNKELLDSATSDVEKLTEENSRLAEEVNTQKEELAQQRQEMERQKVELEKQSMTIGHLTSNLEEKTKEITSLDRNRQEVEYLKETLLKENQSIREMIAQGASGLNDRLAEKDEYHNKIHALDLKVMEQNNQIEDLNRLAVQDKEKIGSLTAEISELTTEISELKSNLELEKQKRDEDHDRYSAEKETMYNKHVQEQVEKEEAAEMVVSDLKAMVDKANSDRDVMESELNNFAKRLSDQSEKITDYERQVAEQQKEMESIIHTRDNLIRELEELQGKQQLDGASRESEEKLVRELNDLKLRYEEEKNKLQKNSSDERQTFESRRWEIVAELEQEKNKSRKVQEELLEERRRLGVVSKTVEKFLNETNINESNITLESFYAMLEAAKKELLDGFHHKRKYYDDEDLLAQLHMEREARRLAESQVEHFAVLLEKKRMELNALRPPSQAQSQQVFSCAIPKWLISSSRFFLENKKMFTNHIQFKMN